MVIFFVCKLFIYLSVLIIRSQKEEGQKCYAEYFQQILNQSFSMHCGILYLIICILIEFSQIRNAVFVLSMMSRLNQNHFNVYLLYKSIVSCSKRLTIHSTVLCIPSQKVLYFKITNFSFAPICCYISFNTMYTGQMWSILFCHTVPKSFT